jgi:drug/metabolite transporter (DMT)-like permease
LGVLPSGMAYLLYFRAVATLGAERSAFVNYIIPSVALLSGVIILGEQLGVIELVSFVLALFALILGMGTQKSVRSQRNRRPQEI